MKDYSKNEYFKKISETKKDGQLRLYRHIRRHKVTGNIRSCTGPLYKEHEKDMRRAGLCGDITAVDNCLETALLIENQGGNVEFGNIATAATAHIIDDDLCGSYKTQGHNLVKSALNQVSTLGNKNSKKAHIGTLSQRGVGVTKTLEWLEGFLRIIYNTEVKIGKKKGDGVNLIKTKEVRRSTNTDSKSIYWRVRTYEIVEKGRLQSLEVATYNAGGGPMVTWVVTWI